MVKLTSLIEYMDFYSAPPIMYYCGNQRMTSCFGGVLTICMFMILIIIIYFCAFSGMVEDISKYYDPSKALELNFKDLNLTFAIIDPVSGNPIQDESIFGVNLASEKLNRNNNYNLEYLKIANYKLDITKNIFTPKDKNTQFKLSRENLLVLEVFKYCKYQLYICPNSTNRNFAKNKYYISFANNYYDTTQEFPMKTRDEYFGFIGTNGKSILYNVDEYSLIKTDIINDNGNEISSSTISAEEIYESNTDDLFLRIIFIYSGNRIKIRHTKKKIPTIIAEISGIFNFVLFIFNIFYKISGRVSLENYIYSKFESKSLYENNISKEKDNAEKRSYSSRVSIAIHNPPLKLNLQVPDFKKSNIIINKQTFQIRNNTNDISNPKINDNDHIYETETIKINPHPKTVQIKKISGGISPVTKKVSSPIMNSSALEKIKGKRRAFGNTNDLEDKIERVGEKHDRAVEQTNSAVNFLNKFMPKQLEKQELSLRNKVLSLYRGFMDPLNIMNINMKLLFTMHLLLNEEKMSIIEEFCNDENIIGTTYDFLTIFKPKLKNMRTFIDPNHLKYQLESNDNLFFAILNNLKSKN